MNILIIGDIYSSPGRNIVKKWIPEVKEYFEKQNSNIDFVIANGENVTHGKSISFSHYKELKNAGVDVITSGNHIFAPSTDILSYIDRYNDILRPLNYSPYHPGFGSVIVECKGKKIRVSNLIGRTFMDKSDNPYFALEQILNLENNDENEKSDIHIVDFHAEATAEKLAFAWNFDGLITCLVGTHTHVQTADNKLLPKKTAFISDVGMSGAYDSIIGANPLEVIYRDKNSLPAKFRPAEDLSGNRSQFCAVVLTIDEETNKAVQIKRIFITPENKNLILFD